jgi:hypothetical protein
MTQLYSSPVYSYIHAHVPWNHKCITQTIGCAASHKCCIGVSILRGPQLQNGTVQFLVTIWYLRLRHMTSDWPHRQAVSSPALTAYLISVFWQVERAHDWCNALPATEETPLWSSPSTLATAATYSAGPFGLRDLMFSELSFWGLRIHGMWHCVVGSVLLTFWITIWPWRWRHCDALQWWELLANWESIAHQRTGIFEAGAIYLHPPIFPALTSFLLCGRLWVS